MQELPALFLDQIRNLLGEDDEFEAFVHSYEEERGYGLRYNPLKFHREEFLREMPFSLKPVLWSREGFFYLNEDRPGKHVFHEAGAYYIQEPSAMIVTELLDPQPGERVLDLCAAPGGKSTQIIGRMQKRGLLVSNEIQPVRVKALSQNLERMGSTCALVVNEKPERLSERFEGFFDRILVDAPCSGEGMFRKEEEAVREWSPEAVGLCAVRQKEILEEAAKMLTEGGVLVYSTCTFSREEDEDVIEDFLQKHKEFAVDMKELPSDWEAGGVVEGFSKGTVRMWPHHIKGEGHFAVRMIKGENAMPYHHDPVPGIAQKNVISAVKSFLEFGKNFFANEKQREFENIPAGRYDLFGNMLYLLPEDCPDLKGIKVVRAGLCLGEVKKDRFEPDHALSMSLRKDDVRITVETAEMVSNSKAAEGYLRGETLSCDGDQKGWGIAVYHDLPLGFVKVSGGTAKNHYPKGLRKDLI